MKEVVLMKITTQSSRWDLSITWIYRHARLCPYLPSHHPDSGFERSAAWNCLRDRLEVKLAPLASSLTCCSPSDLVLGVSAALSERKSLSDTFACVPKFYLWLWVVGVSVVTSCPPADILSLAPPKRKKDIQKKSYGKTRQRACGSLGVQKLTPELSIATKI